MPSPAAIDRTHLEQALLASGCRIDLDAALADPTLARCLRLAAESMSRRDPAHPDQPTPETCAWTRRLRRLVSDVDWQRLQAGDTDHQ